MKRFTKLLALSALSTAFFGWTAIQGQSYYKVHHINQSFDGLGGTVLPDGWSTTASTAALFSRSGGTNTDNGMLRQGASGSGNRGMDIAFPSPTITDADGKIWFVEFDWKCTKVVMGPKNAFGLVFSGSTNNKNLRAANWYVASIFGLYLNGDGYFHYWNQDLTGPYQSDAATRASTPQYYNHMGPVFRGGSSDGAYSRNGVAATHTTDSVTAWNTSTKTNVAFVYDSISKIDVPTYGPRYLASKTYHIKAELDFTTQRVVNLTITQADNTANTQTISNMPFMAPSMIGNDTTVVARQDRVVNDLKFISQFNTRTSTAGSGPNVDYLTYVDNMEIYYLKQSTGTTDVTVNYVDQDGNIAKTARIAVNQQNNEIFKLTDTDKGAFYANGNYYAYNSSATYDANIANGTDGFSITTSPTNKTLTVVFKRFVEATNPMTWTGYEGPYWNEMDGNFKSGNTTGLGYQEGKAVELSDASAPKDIIVSGTIDLGASNLTISSPGYNLTGNGNTADKIVASGNGKTIINAAVTLGAVNTTDVYINTTDGVLITNANCADTLHVVDNALLQLNQSASISKKIVGAGKSSILNIEALASTSGIDYSYGISNISTVNIKLKNAGKVSGSSWTSRMNGTYADSTQLNVTNNIVGKDTLAGFSGISSTGLAKVKVHLGDSVRLVRGYNEAANETVTIGEISGTSKSIIEAGFVAFRSQTYAVGNLNTDAIFNGAIRPFLLATNVFRVGNTLHLAKIGTGKWTLGGKLSFAGDIEVKAGTLELLGAVTDSVKTITVDSLATLTVGGIQVNSKNIAIKNGALLNSNSSHFIGDVQVSGTLSGAVSSYSFGAINGNLNLKINSFEADDYQKIVSESDINLIRTKINLTVSNAKTGQIIQILSAGSGMISYPEGTDGSSVYVNGEDITANTDETPDAKYIYYPETGELKCMINYTDINNPEASKEIKSIQYFNILGREIKTTQLKLRENNGIIIRKTIYTDNSTKVDKIRNNQ